MNATYIMRVAQSCLLILSVTAAASAQAPVDSARRAAAENASARLLQHKWETFFLVRNAQNKVSALNAPRDERFQRAPQRRTLALASTAAFQEPSEIVSAAGILNSTLTVAYAHNSIGGDPVHLRSYNGKLVGPTLRARAGDSLRITLLNNLPPNTTGSGHNNHHEWNTTNLHTHGLHVSPAGNSDNVLLDVLPGDRQDYRIDIPANHPAGTFWYHAHRHGSVAGQVSSGMSGAIIIAGAIDSVPAIAAAKDRVWVLQQIPYYNQGLPEGEIELTEAGDLFGPGDWDASDRFTTVNGVVLPVITMRPGEVERWRLVDSAFRERIDLKIEKASGGGPNTIPFQEIAVDGLPLGTIVKKDVLELWPGYRSEVLVQAPAMVGEYLIVDEQVPVGSGINGNGKDRRHIAKLVIAGAPHPMSVPTNAELATFRLPSIPAAAVTGTQAATYGINPVGAGLQFQIDGKSFGSGFVRSLSLGKTEEWTLRSVNGVGPVTHPFHIHVNPFEVISVTEDATGAPAVDEPTPTWRDTLALKPGRTYKVRTTYGDYTGDFVQHCHILDHEDQGMMELVRVQSASVTPSMSQLPAIGPLAEFRGRPVVVVLIEGLDCPACVDQVKQLASKITNAAVVVVTPTAETDASKTSMPGVRVIANPDHSLFRAYGAFRERPQHGVAVLDAKGKAVFSASGDKPFTDVATLQAAVAQHSVAAGAGATDKSCTCAAASTLPRVRKNIDCLTADELAVYKHAIEIVKQRSAANPSDPTGFDWQVRVHGSPLVGPCKHNTELIWPWHRAMLYYFEETLRATDPDHPTLSTRNLTIPYWDWTKAPTGVTGYPAAYEDPASPLYHRGRNLWGATNLPPLFTADDVGLDLADWGLFGGTTVAAGQLESITHNEGHGLYVGGDMASPATSPKDPIFWSHHANLDRMWDLWQQRHGVNPAQQSVVLRGWGTSVSPASIVSNFNDIRGQLGYDYCNPAETRSIELAMPEQSSGPVSLDVRLSSLRPVRPVRKSIAQVRLQGVSIPQDFSYRVQVYLHPANVPFEPQSADFRDRYLAGRFTVWGDDIGEHRDSQHSENVNLDVSRAYEALSGELGDSNDIKVSFDFQRIENGKTTRVHLGSPGINARSARLVIDPPMLHKPK